MWKSLPLPDFFYKSKSCTKFWKAIWQTDPDKWKFSPVLSSDYSFMWWLLCRDHKPFSVKAISIFVWFTFIILPISVSENSSCLWFGKSWGMSSAKCRLKYLISIHHLISIKRTNLITNSCTNLRKSIFFHNIPNQTLVCSYFEKLVFTLTHFNLRQVLIVIRNYEDTFLCTE